MLLLRFYTSIMNDSFMVYARIPAPGMNILLEKVGYADTPSGETRRPVFIYVITLKIFQRGK